MTEKNIFDAVKASREYSAVCDDTVLRITRGELPKFKAEKQAVKSVKNILHQITGAFVRDSDITAAAAIVDAWADDITPENFHADLRRILSLHASARERLDFSGELMGDILKVTSPKDGIIDIACGLNPFALPFLPEYKQIEYFATDINVKSVALLNRYFRKAEINGTAEASDILTEIPPRRAGVALLFKLLPLIERQKKGYCADLLRGLDCAYFAVTFPTKTLGGKNVGMYESYRNFMGKLNIYPVVFEKEFKNEILFVLAKN